LAQVFPPPAVPMPAVVNVQARTWTRDSHDLFDYESRHVRTSSLDVRPSSSSSGEVALVRRDAAVTAVPSGEALPDGMRPLLHLQWRQENPWVVSHGEPLWVVVSDTDTRSHVLQTGDRIKLGRFCLRVRQLCTSDDDDVAPELSLSESQVHIHVPDQSTVADKPCRICLLEGQADDDPLVSPCRCSGSIQYIHLACLRHWISGLLNLDQEQATRSLFVRQLSCELCQAPYPTHVVDEAGAATRLAQIPTLAPPFVVLENDAGAPGPGVYVVSLSDSKLAKLGRGHEADVRVSDVSISRCHAKIRMGTEGFILEDNDSKFGTLVATESAECPLVDAMTLQVGRTVVQLVASAGSGAADDVEDSDHV